MFQRNIKLSLHSNYRIGGPASYFFVAKNADELVAALNEWRKNGVSKPVFLMGGGTNLLINDKGFDGLVIKFSDGGIKVEENKIRVSAGVSMAELLAVSEKAGLSGLEWAGGLPGTVGGAIRGNAGAFGGETKDAVVEVTSVEVAVKKLRVIKRLASNCQFSYRNSIFKINDGQEVIVEAIFALKKGNPKEIVEKIREKIEYRKNRQPLDYPNIGSVFKNVDLKLIPEKLREKVAPVVKTDPFPVVPTAYLISEAGLKGVSYGGAMISPKHPNFIINVLDASSEDVKNLIQLVKSEVQSKFGVILEEEIIYL